MGNRRHWNDGKTHVPHAGKTGTKLRSERRGNENTRLQKRTQERDI